MSWSSLRMQSVAAGAMSQGVVGNGSLRTMRIVTRDGEGGTNPLALAATGTGIGE